MASDGSKDPSLHKNEGYQAPHLPSTSRNNEEPNSLNSDALPTDARPAALPPSNGPPPPSEDSYPPPNGGVKAWVQVLGSWMLIFNTWGIHGLLLTNIRIDG
jgi:hypothetical protein